MPVSTRVKTILLLLGMAAALPVAAVSNTFTYQGSLRDGGNPANGAYDLRFALQTSAGTPVGAPLLRDDVAVVQGLFSVELNFGSAISSADFQLEIAVRPGASTGAFTVLSPVSRLTPAPQAQVAGLAVEAVTVSPGAIGSTQINPSQVQARVGGNCAVGSSIRAIDANGLVTCEADDVGTGTVTSVATGAGLNGGPITATGTISLAPTQLLPTTACGNDQIPKWNGIAWTCASEAGGAAGTVTQVQSGVGLNGGPITTAGTINIQPTFRLPQNCNTDQIIRWNGLVWVCAPPIPALPPACAPGQSLTYTAAGNLECAGVAAVMMIDSIGDVGRASAIAVAADGVPVISYFDGTADTIKVARCRNPGCSGASTIATIGATGPVTQSRSSIAVPADGRPVISYYDFANSALMFNRCANGACSGTNVPITLDNSGPVGATNAIAISPSSGFPVIAFVDQTVLAGQVLKLLNCGDAGCSSGNTINIVDATGNVGLAISLAIPADGLAVISYSDVSNRNLKVAKCINPACSGGTAILTAFDVAEDSGGNTAIALGTDGLPVVAYTSGPAGLSQQSLKVLKCATAACNASTAISVVDSSIAVTAPAIAVPSDGLPVIAYRDGGQLKSLKCGNSNCTAGNVISLLDGGPGSTSYISIAVLPGGVPVIAYNNDLADDLLVYVCATAACRAP